MSGDPVPYPLFFLYQKGKKGGSYQNLFLCVPLSSTLIAPQIYLLYLFLILVDKLAIKLIISTVTADTTWHSPCCIGGLCGVIGADDVDDVYSKPQCRRISCVPGLSL